MPAGPSGAGRRACPGDAAVTGGGSAAGRGKEGGRGGGKKVSPSTGVNEAGISAGADPAEHWTPARGGKRAAGKLPAGGRERQKLSVVVSV